MPDLRWKMCIRDRYFALRLGGTFISERILRIPLTSTLMVSTSASSFAKFHSSVYSGHGASIMVSSSGQSVQTVSYTHLLNQALRIFFLSAGHCFSHLALSFYFLSSSSLSRPLDVYKRQPYSFAAVPV